MVAGFLAVLFFVGLTAWIPFLLFRDHRELRVRLVAYGLLLTSVFSYGLLAWLLVTSSVVI